MHETNYTVRNHIVNSLFTVNITLFYLEAVIRQVKQSGVSCEGIGGIITQLM